VIETEPCQKVIEKIIIKLKFSWLQKIEPSYSQNDWFVKIGEAKNVGIHWRILQNVIEKSFINWRVLSLVEINSRISDTPCIYQKLKVPYF
jgi:hypothetical protein